MGQNKSRMMLFIVIAIVAVAGILIYMFRSQLTDVLTGLTGKTPQPLPVEQQLAKTKWSKIELTLESSPAQGAIVYKDSVINYTATIKNNDAGKTKAVNLIFLSKLPYQVDPEITSIPSGTENKSQKGLVAITGIGVGAGQSQTITFSMKVPSADAEKNSALISKVDKENRVSTASFLIPGKITLDGTPSETIEWAIGKLDTWIAQQQSGPVQDSEFLFEEATETETTGKANSSNLKAEASETIADKAGEIQTVHIELEPTPPDGSTIKKGDKLEYKFSLTSDYDIPADADSQLIIKLPFTEVEANLTTALPADTITTELGYIKARSLELRANSPLSFTFNLTVPQDLADKKVNYCQLATAKSMVCTTASFTEDHVPAAGRTVSDIAQHILDDEVVVKPEQPEPVQVQIIPKVALVYHVRGSDEAVIGVPAKIIGTKMVKKANGEFAESISAVAGDSVYYQLKVENASTTKVDDYKISDDVSDLEAYTDIEKVETVHSDGSTKTTTYSDSKVESVVSLGSYESATTTIQAKIKPINQWPANNDKKIVNIFLDKQTEVGLVGGTYDENKDPTPTGTTGGATGTKTASVETGIDSSVMLVLIYSGLAVIGATLIYLVVRQKA